jgi:uncharacterized membrane protein YecN with MAPEG domain
MSRAPIADDASRGEPSLIARQAGVAVSASVAAAITAAIFGLSARSAADHSPLETWALAALGPLASLAAAIVALAQGRFYSSQDIDAAAGGPPSAFARMTQAVIQNTLEQAVLALGVYGLLVTALPAEQSGIVWVLSAAFVVGRIAFAIGYPFGAAGRAFGFALTFFPSVVGLVWAASRLLG